MSPKPHYPHSNQECIKLLESLGFKRKFGTGRGKHPFKYTHPTKRNENLNDKPFVLISHDFFDEKGKRLVAKLIKWGFSEDQIRSIIDNIL